MATKQRVVAPLFLKDEEIPEDPPPVEPPPAVPNRADVFTKGDPKARETR